MKNELSRKTVTGIRNGLFIVLICLVTGPGFHNEAHARDFNPCDVTGFCNGPCGPPRDAFFCGYGNPCCDGKFPLGSCGTALNSCIYTLTPSIDPDCPTTFGDGQHGCTASEGMSVSYIGCYSYANVFITLEGIGIFHLHLFATRADAPCCGP